jgi:hypothetical protein
MQENNGCLTHCVMPAEEWRSVGDSVGVVRENSRCPTHRVTQAEEQRSGGVSVGVVRKNSGSCTLSLFTQPPHEGQPNRSAHAASASAPPFHQGVGTGLGSIWYAGDPDLA